VRVVAGSAKGLRLQTIAGPHVRPTTDAMRETLFSSLADCVPESRFLDLFAGTGAVGIEALSRGAAYAVFVEQNARAAQVISQNLALTKLGDRAQVVRGDVLRVLPRLAEQGEPFDLVFADPPYDYPALENVLRLLWEERLAVASDALIVIQHDRRRDLSVIAEPRKVKAFGESVLSMFW